MVRNERPTRVARELFIDERDTGLRVTWHPEREFVVLSVWRDDVCTGTFRLPIEDVPRLSALLATVTGHWIAARRPRPAAGGGGQESSWLRAVLQRFRRLSA
jgi:hypothetical protein